MNYQMRILKASRQLLRAEWRGEVFPVEVRHDDECAALKGGECNYNPDIVMKTPTGTFEVDRNGCAHLVPAN